MLLFLIKKQSILNETDKKSKLVAIYVTIGMMVAAFITLLFIFGTSISYSVFLIQGNLSDATRGEVACFVDKSTACTNCNATENRCPEWTEAQVDSVVHTQIKFSATLSAIFLVYAVRIVRLGITTRTYYEAYQIAYV